MSDMLSKAGTGSGGRTLLKSECEDFGDGCGDLCGGRGGRGGGSLSELGVGGCSRMIGTCFSVFSDGSWFSAFSNIARVSFTEFFKVSACCSAFLKCKDDKLQ